MTVHEDQLTPPESQLDELQLTLRPVQLQKLPPCQAACPNSGDIRGWLALIAQHDKLGLSLDTAYRKAWEKIVDRNPFPATLGRICPHPCETNCTRTDKDGAVGINALERFLGDWGLAQKLPLPAPETGARTETVGVIGAGPAGLSFAYQMARRGYPVTVYEKNDEPGGVLRYGIPDFRLPVAVVTAEIQRILDLSVGLRLGTAVGRDISVEELRSRHAVLFLGMGAQRSRQLGIPGEPGPGVWPGTDYLRLRKCGYEVDLGGRVAVIGGGNTAIDAARTARRDGAEVTLIYRRTREEMPAIAGEVDDALTEGVAFEFLMAPTAVVRDGDMVRGLSLQRMRLGEPDDSGRRRPVPVPGAEDQLQVNAVVVAISQELDGEALEHIGAGESQLATDASGRLDDRLWAGGDDRGLGIAGLAIAQGRQAAEAAHAELRGLTITDAKSDAPVRREQVKTDYYESRPPLIPPRRPTEDWLAEPNREIDRTMSGEEAVREASRCFSCGLCFGCQQCWMYCNAGGFIGLTEAQPGNYFKLNIEVCEGCGKCIEVCPSGYLSVTPERRSTR